MELALKTEKLIERSIIRICLILFVNLVCFSGLSQESVTEKEYLDLIDYLTNQLLIDSTDIFSLENRGLAYMNIGNFDAAIKDYHFLVQLDSTNNKYYGLLGLSYSYLLDHPRAVKYYSQAISYNPFYVDHYINRGVSYEMLNKYELAKMDYLKSIKIEETNQKALINLAYLYHDYLDNNDESITVWNRLLKIDPFNASYYNDRGLIFLDENKIDHSLQDFLRAIQLDPRKAAHYYNCARAYEKLGEVESALMYYEKAIDADSVDSNIYFYRSKLYEKMGDSINAKIDLKKVIELEERYE
ncbi:tetratricopeptide repeat protein [Roseivirga pacifica]|uniref:tetratricopeptide repeat protein n=1 Tax=Roseivirga pacifica TaxID=1267423 RepID=UPI003BAAE015